MVPLLEEDNAKNCEHEENKIGLFECVFKTAFGLPGQTRFLRYEVQELVPIVEAALRIANGQD